MDRNQQARIRASRFKEVQQGKAKAEIAELRKKRE